MSKLYRIPLLGDTVFTDQVKPETIFYFAQTSSESYLKDIKRFDARLNPSPKKFVFNPKPLMEVVQDTPAEPMVKQPKFTGKMYGPKLPTEQQLKNNLKRLDFEKEVAKREMESRLSRNHGWTYMEVYTIASAAFMQGLEMGIGDVPEDKFNEFVEMAKNAATKNIQAWQDYEVENYKKEKYG